MPVCARCAATNSAKPTIAARAGHQTTPRPEEGTFFGVWKVASAVIYLFFRRADQQLSLERHLRASCSFSSCARAPAHARGGQPIMFFCWGNQYVFAPSAPLACPEELIDNASLRKANSFCPTCPLTHFPTCPTLACGHLPPPRERGGRLARKGRVCTGGGRGARTQRASATRKSPHRSSKKLTCPMSRGWEKGGRGPRSTTYGGAGQGKKQKKEKWRAGQGKSASSAENCRN